MYLEIWQLQMVEMKEDNVLEVSQVEGEEGIV